ncbi:hypothetical protein [Streptomyces sp. NPDC053720]|uniref:hypothetical protein n=1 Tax=Streptomyces sp. NPDC053720 TaxID=3154855 RepID=UPI00343B0AEE
MSLSEAITDRLAFLTADTRDMLRTAALLGPAFGITDLTLLLGPPAMTLAAPVHEAVAAGVLEPADGNRLRFRHGLIKQVLYQSVPAALRIAIHRDAAQTLIAQRTSVKRVAELLLSAADAADGWEVDWLVDNAATLIRRAPEAATSLLQTRRGAHLRRRTRRGIAGPPRLGGLPRQRLRAGRSRRTTGSGRHCAPERNVTAHPTRQERRAARG